MYSNSMLLDSIVGHKETISYLIRLIKQENIPPLIFYGKSGIGKRKTAIALGGAINCQNQGCEMCLSCKTLKTHPDIKQIKDDNGYIKIDTIREIINEASLRPTYKKRVYIIDNAHFLTEEASNCLLKTLEEASSALFILITNSISSILPTIRSRCFIVRFKPLSFSEFKRLGIEDEMLIEASSGSMERILDYGKKDIEKAKEELLLWISDLKTLPGGLLINRFLEMDKRFPFILELLIVLLKKKGLYSMIDNVLKAKEALKAHVNRRFALEKMVLGFKND